MCVGVGRSVKGRVLFNIACAVALQDCTCVYKKQPTRSIQAFMCDKCESMYVRMCLCMCVSV